MGGCKRYAGARNGSSIEGHGGNIGRPSGRNGPPPGQGIRDLCSPVISGPVISGPAISSSDISGPVFRVYSIRMRGLCHGGLRMHVRGLCGSGRRVGGLRVGGLREGKRPDDRARKHGTAEEKEEGTRHGSRQVMKETDAGSGKGEGDLQSGGKRD